MPRPPVRAQGLRNVSTPLPPPSSAAASCLCSDLKLDRVASSPPQISAAAELVQVASMPPQSSQVSSNASTSSTRLDLIDAARLSSSTCIPQARPLPLDRAPPPLDSSSFASALLLLNVGASDPSSTPRPPRRAQIPLTPCAPTSSTTPNFPLLDASTPRRHPLLNVSTP